MKRIVILGAGTGGTLLANKLVQALPDWAVQVIDRDDAHLYQPGLLFLPFGGYRESELVRSRKGLIDPRVQFTVAELNRIAPDEHRVYLQGGARVPYDILVVATGSRVTPEATQGLTAVGWRDNAFDFYTLDGARALRDRLARFDKGRLVLNVAEMPIKCPVAPLEFLFLADAYFTQRGVRKDIDIVYATPLEGAFTKPKASALLGDMLGKRGISVVPEFAVSEVDGAARTMKAFDGREVDYDLLVSIPLHAGSEAIARSGLGDVGGWFPTDKHTLQSRHHPDVFAIGDATDVPASKAGAVAHFQGDVLLTNIVRHTEGQPPLPEFDGHANCFIETGHGKAMLIDFNYTTEPLPGRFPLPAVGPFTLLQESAVNHWGKLAFKWIYWNVLLAGKELPLDHRMLMAGKWA
ncbi:MAG: NAD(P)/FAD-dependent oxidoreductase [Deltaproteobacteria bacterium]|nr:NAD(P)/FAD-dependent oxidoreductase [Deltaproteobacteria bacterium]